MWLILGLLLTVCVLGAITQTQLIGGNSLSLVTYSLSLVTCSFVWALNKGERRAKGGCIVMHWQPGEFLGGRKTSVLAGKELVYKKGLNPYQLLQPVVLVPSPPPPSLLVFALQHTLGVELIFQQVCLMGRVREGDEKPSSQIHLSLGFGSGCLQRENPRRALLPAGKRSCLQTQIFFSLHH